MSVEYIKAPQRSDEWHAARVGIVTASKMSCVLADLVKGKESAVRRDYRMHIVCERLTGRPYENGYTDANMQWGTDQEPFARQAYSIVSGNLPLEVGFCRKSIESDFIGASVDATISDNGILEIKCPKTSTHLAWMDAGVVPSQHYAQIQTGLLVTERKWCDFVSFDPRLPEDLQLFIVTVEKDDNYCKLILDSTKMFYEEVAETINKLRK